jgi:hypothetical protein
MSASGHEGRDPQTPARAVAVQQAVITMFWAGFYRPLWGDPPSPWIVGKSLSLVALTAVVALVLAPVASQARSALGVVLRSLALGVAGGALVGLVTAPVDYLGARFAPGVTLAGVLREGALVGAMGGFFSGFAASVILRYRLRTRPAFDLATRVHAFAGASLLPFALTLLGLGGWLRDGLWVGAPFLLAGAGLVTAALVSRRRRLAWLGRVREGREPGFRIEEATVPATELPSFAGSGEGARGVLLQEVEPAAVHPFRDERRPAPLARVHIDAAEAGRQATEALYDALTSGALAGIGVVFLLGVPAVLLAAAMAD